MTNWQCHPCTDKVHHLDVNERWPKWRASCIMTRLVKQENKSPGQHPKKASYVMYIIYIYICSLYVCVYMCMLGSQKSTWSICRIMLKEFNLSKVRFHTDFQCHQMRGIWDPDSQWRTCRSTIFVGPSKSHEILWIPNIVNGWSNGLSNK